MHGDIDIVRCAAFRILAGPDCVAAHCTVIFFFLIERRRMKRRSSRTLWLGSRLDDLARESERIAHRWSKFI
jgi:hypothetical protein